MSLNIGSNIISPIQRNNVINNLSNKTIIPNQNQQVITPASEPVNVTIPGTSGRTFSSSPIEVNIDASFLIYGETYQVVADRIYYRTNYRSSTYSSISINTQWVAGEDEEIPFTIVGIGSNDGTPTKVTLSKNKIRIYATSVSGGDIGINGNNGTISFTYLGAYDGLDQVTIEPIPSDYIIPEGTLTISAPGIINAASYASVSIPGMTTPTWNTATITNNTGKINYSINLSSGFKSTSQTFTSSITLPSTAGTTITPSTTSQTAVAQYRWTTGSVIVESIPASITVYQKIIEKTISNPNELSTVFSNQTSIPNYAFLHCLPLSGTLNLASITTIGSCAFSNCINLSAVIGLSVTNIYSGAFSNCQKLSIVSFPELQSIGDTVFMYDSKITELSFPKLTSTGGFSYMYSLTTINFPLLTSIGTYGFYCCYSLTNVNMPELAIISYYYPFGSCKNLSYAYFSKLTLIAYGYGHFMSCTNLSWVSFPMLSQISNASSVFVNCTKLMSVYLMSTSVVNLSQTYQSNIFNSTPITNSGLTGTFGSIYVPSSLLTSYKTHSIWSYWSDRFVGV